MASIGKFILIAGLLAPATVAAQTNLDVAWRICGQHGHLIGRASAATGPAKWVFDPNYSSCEAIQKLISTEKPEVLDPNKAITDQMLIGRALANPAGKPQ